jgi:hypothetical protein
VKRYVVAPTLLYGSEVWATGAADKKRMEVMKMKFMRAVWSKHYE